MVFKTKTTKIFNYISMYFRISLFLGLVLPYISLINQGLPCHFSILCIWDCWIICPEYLQFCPMKYKVCKIKRKSNIKKIKEKNPAYTLDYIKNEK